MTTVQPPALDDVARSLRAAIDALTRLDLTTLSPDALAAVAHAATRFTHDLSVATRRRPQRGRRQTAGTHNPEGAA